MKKCLDYQLMIVAYSKRQVVYCALAINIIRLTNLYFTKCHPKPEGALACYREQFWNRYSNGAGAADVSETHFNFAVMVIILSLIQVGKESSLVSVVDVLFRAKKGGADGGKAADETLEEVPTEHNVTFLRTVACQLLVALAYLGFVVLHFRVTGVEVAVLPHYASWALLVVFSLALIAYEEAEKKKIRHRYTIDGRFMKIFFTTRLGMWSPR